MINHTFSLCGEEFTITAKHVGQERQKSFMRYKYELGASFFPENKTVIYYGGRREYEIKKPMDAEEMPRYLEFLILDAIDGEMEEVDYLRQYHDKQAKREAKADYLRCQQVAELFQCLPVSPEDLLQDFQEKFTYLWSTEK